MDKRKKSEMKQLIRKTLKTYLNYLDVTTIFSKQRTCVLVILYKKEKKNPKHVQLTTK